MNTTFNLLNYPMQAHQRRLRWRFGSALVGGLIGLAMGGGVLHGMRLDLDSLASERDLLQSQNARRHAQARGDKARREALALAQGQQRLLEQVQQHQQAWSRLHHAVLEEAGRQGWTLERLQVDGDRLELQGRVRDVQALAMARARLSAQLQSPLTLLSLAASPTNMAERPVSDMGHVFVWQGPWPSLQPSANRQSP